MRFMMTVKANENSEAGVPPSQELIAAIGKHTEELRKAGTPIETTAAEFGWRTPPFAEAKELSATDIRRMFDPTDSASENR
jgi:hypothetical protein